ncbi:DUF2268 domain-containing putative Zn-dependent protease [Virgibacillus kekensis]|uniref:DUF2268 domain-containing putative Zn-dependent protease n=1 Tax=Virgibacillus kekensis TaxID=202261 RepID=A0ABV9DKH7_9BACI
MKKAIIFFLVTTLWIGGCESSGSKDGEHTQPSTKYAKTSEQSTNEASAHKEDGEKYVTTAENENGQTFRVISAYEWVDQYVKKVEDIESKSERFKLWKKVVMDHTQNQCFSGASSQLVEDYVYSPPANLGKIKSQNKVLNVSNIENLTIKALKASSNKFPGPNTIVCILPQEKANYVGLSIGAGRISIFYSSSYSEVLLKSTIAHEYHHSTWSAKYAENYKWDLLGNIIFEGKAEYFASLLYGQPPTAVYNYMNADEEKKLWNKAKSVLHSTDRKKIHTVLFGGDKGFPSNFGYIVGYHIVRDYVESHPNTTIEEWSKLSPKELYEASGYEDSF